MNRTFKKCLVTGASLLMLAGTGASVSNVKTPVHASRISRLRGQMDKDYREARRYNSQANKIKRELNRLTHHSNRRNRRHGRRAQPSPFLKDEEVFYNEALHEAELCRDNGYVSHAATRYAKGAMIHLKVANRNIKHLHGHDYRVINNLRKNVTSGVNMLLQARSVILQNIKIQEHAQQTGQQHVHYVEMH